MVTEQQALDLWRRAQAHPVGLCVRTDNRQNLTQRLYQIRARNKEDFSDMMLRMGAQANEVWIVHRPSSVPVRPMTEEDTNDL